MTGSAAAPEVLAGYSARLSFADADADGLPAPRALGRSLEPGGHVAELPCGAGHFLAAYAAAGVRVTLLDGNPAVLDLACSRARAAGLPPDRVTTVAATIPDVPPLPDVDLVVVPNGALNQLAAQTPLPKLLDRLGAALPAGCRLAAQVLCSHPGGAVDQARWFDPALPAGRWTTDPSWDGSDGTCRRRRQRRDGDRLLVELAFDRDGADSVTGRVEARLLDLPQLTAAFAAGGFAVEQFDAGDGTPSDVVAVRLPEGRPER